MFCGNHTVCQCPILRSDVQKVIEAADRDDYPVIVVGEKQLAIHHLTPIVEKIFVEGLGVDSLDFQTNIDDLKDEDILQLTPFCSIEQESELMLSLEIVLPEDGILLLPILLLLKLIKVKGYRQWLIIWA